MFLKRIHQPANRMIRGCFVLLTCQIMSSHAFGEELTNEVKDAGFVSMFNGVDFDGWRFTGKDSGKAPDNWKVEDGVIKLSGGGNPHLGTAREYADFEMRFQKYKICSSFSSPPCRVTLR